MTGTLLSNPSTPRESFLAASIATVGGFVLINLAFVAYALFAASIEWLMPSGFVDRHEWFPPFRLAIFATLVGAATWFVMKSTLPVIVKAIFMAVPLATVYAAIGLSLYEWPVAVFGIGVAFGVVVLIALRRSRQHWLLVYALAWTSVAMLAVVVTGTEV